MSTAPANAASTSSSTTPVTQPVFSAARTLTAANAVEKKPTSRKVAAVPSKAVVAKAAVRAVKMPVVKAATPKVAVKAAVITPAAIRPVKPASKNSTTAKSVKKPKLVRDSFTIPKAEYLVLGYLRQRAAQLVQPVKKSELLRAGIKALAAMSGTAFRTALKDVAAIKTGRPAPDK